MLSKVISVGLRLLAVISLLLPLAAPFAPPNMFVLFFCPPVVCLIFLIGFYNWYGRLRVDQFVLPDEYRFVDRLYEFARTVVHAPYAGWLGLLTGSIFASAIFVAAYIVQLANSHFDWAEKIPDAAAAFLAGLSTFYVINVFYNRLAPYSDIWELLEQIRDDVRSALKSTRPVKVIWIYAGFGLGHYRSLADNGTPNHNSQEYLRFKQALLSLFNTESVEVTAISYSPNQLRAFFCSYEYQNTVNTLCQRQQLQVDPYDQSVSPKNTRWTEILGRARLTKCLEEEAWLADHCRNGSGTNSLYFVKDPDDMPPNLIMIDDIVYHISSFGFPLFRQLNRDALVLPYTAVRGFFEPNNQEKLIKMIAFRSQDRGLADVVANHIQHYIDLGVAGGALEKQPRNGTSGAAEFYSSPREATASVAGVVSSQQEPIAGTS